MILEFDLTKFNHVKSLTFFSLIYIFFICLLNMNLSSVYLQGWTRMWDSIKEHIEFKSNKFKFLEKLVDSFSPKVAICTITSCSNCEATSPNERVDRKKVTSEGIIGQLLSTKPIPQVFDIPMVPNADQCQIKLRSWLMWPLIFISLVSQVIGFNFSGWSLVMDQT